MVPEWLAQSVVITAVVLVVAVVVSILRGE
jgi:hypothetical protein